MHFNQVVRLGEVSVSRAPVGLRATSSTILLELPNEAAKEIPKADSRLHPPFPGAGSHYRISGGFLT